MMNSFDFPGVGAISFGVARVEQLAKDISSLMEKEAAVVLMSDAGVAKAGILGRVQSILERSGHDVEKPEDLTARSGVLLASTLAGIAFGTTGTAAAHSIGHALATIADIPHGRRVAIGSGRFLGMERRSLARAVCRRGKGIG